MPLKKIERNVQKTDDTWVINDLNQYYSLLNRRKGRIEIVHNFSSTFRGYVSEWCVKVWLYNHTFPRGMGLAFSNSVNGLVNVTCNFYLVDIDKNYHYVGRVNRKATNNFQILKVFGNLFADSRLPRKKEELLPNNTMTLHIELLTYLDDNPIFPIESLYFTNVPVDDLPEEYLDLYNHRKNGDVIIWVQDNQFPVHGIVLKTRCSEWYNDVACHQLSSGNNNNNELTLKGIDPEIFKRVLEYIYTGKVNDLDDYSEYLLEAADKFKLIRLKQMCQISIGNNYFTAKNCKEVFDLATRCHAIELKDAAGLNLTKMKYGGFYGLV
ncbi:speckle-type POZ protein-like [Microplitis mediator]|uniref:speckle-type POZ protein-like n=1 Tax=Microplitis mediator TaxID=375433 RepID=UPI0025575484|nr:speckle-type POZ protein-like [Microplitis mediator]